MKSVLKTLLALVAVALLAAACNMFASLPDRMDAFVDSVEKNAANYTQDDWNKANEQYQAFCQEFQEKKDSLTGDEVKQFRSAMGRYASIAVKSGIDSVVSSVEEIGNSISGAFEEVGSFLEGLFSGKEEEKTE